MKASKIEYPNPVLFDGRDDYVESCHFITEERTSIGEENICISIKYKLKCSGLQKLITDEKAVVVVVVKSRSASYSRLFAFPHDATELLIEIPKYDVVNRLEVTGSIIAARTIEHFVCPGEFNELYFENITFEIRKGDVLATEETRTIDLEDNPEIEELKPKKKESPFFFAQQNSMKYDITTNFDNQKIIIYLRKDLYETYYPFRDSTFVSDYFVFPALIEALTHIVNHHRAIEMGVNETDTYSEYRWFRIIENKCYDLGIDIRHCDESFMSIADRILEGVSKRALNNFKKEFDSETTDKNAPMLWETD